MKTRLWKFVTVLSGLLIFGAACAPAAAPQTQDLDIPFPIPQATERPAPTELAVPEKTAVKVPAKVLLPSEAKPPLPLAGPDGMDLNQVIGYVFPEGLAAIKASPVDKPWNLDTGLTPVGVVEIGQEAQLLQPGVYTVAIDLISTETKVMGELLPLTGEGSVRVDFDAFPQVENAERTKWWTQLQPPPAANASIGADSVCFLVSVSDASGFTRVTRYCSVAGSVLSVRGNFPNRFESLVSDIDTSRKRLFERGYPDEAQIEPGLTISEMEDPQNIKQCVEAEKPENCGADIVGAPSSSFWDDYKRAKEAISGSILPGGAGAIAVSWLNQAGEAGGFSVTGGLVSVRHEIAIPGEQTVFPGDYWVKFWFDRNDVFIGATITGMTLDGVAVDGQPISAVPATYVNQDGSEPTLSWISAWRLMRWCCFWQSNCP